MFNRVTIVVLPVFFKKTSFFGHSASLFLKRNCCKIGVKNLLDAFMHSFDSI